MPIRRIKKQIKLMEIQIESMKKKVDEYEQQKCNRKCPVRKSS